MNIVDPILFQCRYNPPAPALCAPGSTLNLVSYGRLERFIHNMGRRARSLPLGPGDVVAIVVNDVVFHAAIILALTRLGVVTVSASGPNLPKELGLTAVITDTSLSFNAVGRVVRADPSWLDDDGKPLDPTHMHAADGDDLCRIILTSGTTGTPKGVPFSHRAVGTRAWRNDFVFGGTLPHCARMLVDLPLSTSMGFWSLISTLSRGGTVFLRGPQAADTLQAFGLYQVQSMVTSPAGLAEFLRYYEGTPGLTSRFEVIVSVGSLFSRSLSERVRARICPNLISGYGATEASLSATAPAHVIDQIAGAVGYVTPGVSVEIVGPSDAVLPRGQDGRIRIRSEYVVDGYFANPAASQAVFRNGWFYPGDIGRLTEDGLLVISGREKEVLNIGGDKVSPATIEAAIGAFPGVVDCAVCSFPDSLGLEEVWAAVVASAALDEAALREHCGRVLPREHCPVSVLQVDAIPRNPAGKIEHVRVSELLRSDAHKIR